jgi:uncharacterized phage infection (PIP) family protein YhgE
MNDIVNAVTRVTDIMGEIASASDEQSRGIDQVALAVSEMDRVTQQNASLVQQSAAAAAALEEQASRLTQAVSTFRLSSVPTKTRDGALIRRQRLPAPSAPVNYRTRTIGKHFDCFKPRPLPPDGSVDVKSYSNFDDTFLILILCGVLQVGSNGLSFWAFRMVFRT